MHSTFKLLVILMDKFSVLLSLEGFVPNDVRSTLQWHAQIDRCIYTSFVDDLELTDLVQANCLNARKYSISAPYSETENEIALKHLPWLSVNLLTKSIARSYSTADCFISMCL